MSSVINSAKQLLQPEKEKTWYEELEEGMGQMCPSLSWEQRVIGCLSCLGVGILISLGSFFRIMELINGNPAPFAICYTIGNIVAICGTCFLYGPWNQAKKMFAMTRIGATLIYLTMLFLTLFFAFYEDVDGRLPILIVCIIVQFLALIWYTLSFIPFARNMVKNCCHDICCNCGRGDSEW